MSVICLRPLFVLLSGVIIIAYSDNLAFGQMDDQTRLLDTTTYSVVQVPPKFPGGPNVMFQFIQSASRYPVISKRGSLVVVRLLIEKDGTISNVQVSYDDVDDAFVSEAKRIVNMMPKWIPGSQDGRLLRTYTWVPIRFVKGN